MIAECEQCGGEDANGNQVHYVLTFNGMRWLCEQCAGGVTGSTKGNQ